MVALEMEVLAKKMDRFGWDRDRGTVAHDRLLTDWMDALQDYPLDEVRAACREFVRDKPNVMPNEGHILERISAARALFLRMTYMPAPEPERPRMTRERHAEVAAELGVRVKRFGDHGGAEK